MQISKRLTVVLDMSQHAGQIHDSEGDLDEAATMHDDATHQAMLEQEEVALLEQTMATHGKDALKVLRSKALQEDSHVLAVKALQT